MLPSMWGYKEEDSDSDNCSNPLTALGSWMDEDTLAPPCPSLNEFLPHIYSLCELSPDDVLLDLGCGDGRVCMGAVDNGAKYSVGVEIEEDVCRHFESEIERRALGDRVRCINGDVRTVDLCKPVPAFAETTVIVLYLLPEGTEAVKEKVGQWLKGGGDLPGPRRRCVCNTWGFKDWKWKEKVVVEECNGTNLFLYDAGWDGG